MRCRAVNIACALLLCGCSPIVNGTDASIDSEAGSNDGRGLPLSRYVDGNMGCSTTVVFGLARQLTLALSCQHPGRFVEVPQHPRIAQGPAFFPFLQAAVVEGLVGVADQATDTIMLTSGLRSLPQQYLLYQWGERGVCGVGVVAAPHRSNHLSGSAIDVSNWSTFRSSLEGRGFVWYGSGDEVHFDHPEGTIDTRTDSVLMFQRLWNLNSPEDRIDEDGIFGEQTVARLVRAPASGFPRSLSCMP